MKKNLKQNSLPPTWIVTAIQAFRRLLKRLHDRTFPGNVVLYEKFHHLYLLPSLYTAADLDIAGLLKEGKLGIDDLAAKTGSDPDALYRVLRALASEGIFRESGSKTFSNTRLSLPLTEGHGSLRYMFLHHLGSLNWQIMGELPGTVKSGRDAFSRLFNQQIYDYLSGEPESYKVFDKSMSELSSLGLAPLFQAFDFSSEAKVADIGGGEGFLLANILSRYPLMQGILFDRREGLIKAQATMEEHGVSERVTIHEGDFLASVPGGADLYLLKNILHNWDDPSCITILDNITQVLPDHGRVLIIEMIVPAGNTPSPAKFIDIQMLTSMPGGKERTRKEFEALLQKAGLSLVRIHPTIAPISVIEARRNR